VFSVAQEKHRTGTGSPGAAASAGAEPKAGSFMPQRPQMTSLGGAGVRQ
jgi:hypothetical protein